MSLQRNIEELKQQFEILKNQASSTEELWNDQVQKRFYQEHIEHIPHEFNQFLDAASKLDTLFDEAEQKIENLINQ